jgi:predicted nucleotidyltransferase
MSLVSKYGVTALKLYGSVLAKTETEQSDIDFLAIFDTSTEYDWEACFHIEDELEDLFARRISVLDSRRIPDVFKPAIDIDPVDIMELSSDGQYLITPKNSKIYYQMLDRLFQEFHLEEWERNERITYMMVAEKLSWWFSRLLRLSDNDLTDYQGFYYIEVLALCEKLNPFMDSNCSDEELNRFKELLIEVRKYAQLRVKTKSTNESKN